MLILLLLAIAIRFYPLERLQRGSVLWHVRSGQWLEVSIDTNAQLIMRKAQKHLPIGIDVIAYDAK